MGDVVQFPARKSCFDCVYFVEPTCDLFEEHIESEVHAARDCDDFEHLES